MFHYPGYMRVDNHPKTPPVGRRLEHPNQGEQDLGLTTTEILSHAHPGGVRSLSW
jgi:hypothetical protein